MAEFIILPALVYGLILGIIELVFLAKDEAGMHWLKHGLHALPTMMIFTFVAFNISWTLGLIGVADNFTIDLAARIGIGLIAMIKTKAAASITGRGGAGESWTHVLIIGVLMMTGPYIWEFGLKDILNPYLPF